MAWAKYCIYSGDLSSGSIQVVSFALLFTQKVKFLLIHLAVLGEKHLVMTSSMYIKEAAMTSKIPMHWHSEIECPNVYTERMMEAILRMLPIKEIAKEEHMDLNMYIPEMHAKWVSPKRIILFHV